MALMLHSLGNVMPDGSHSSPDHPTPPHDLFQGTGSQPRGSCL